MRIKQYGEPKRIKLSRARQESLRDIAKAHGVSLEPVQRGGKVFPDWLAAVLAIADGKIPVPGPVVLNGGRGNYEE